MLLLEGSVLGTEGAGVSGLWTEAVLGSECFSLGVARHLRGALF